MCFGDLTHFLCPQAGTVLTWQDAERAKEAGANFLMSPVTNKVFIYPISCLSLL